MKMIKEFNGLGTFHPLFTPLDFSAPKMWLLDADKGVKSNSMKSDSYGEFTPFSPPFHPPINEQGEKGVNWLPPSPVGGGAIFIPHRAFDIQIVVDTSRWAVQQAVTEESDQMSNENDISNNDKPADAPTADVPALGERRGVGLIHPHFDGERDPSGEVGRLRPEPPATDGFFGDIVAAPVPLAPVEMADGSTLDAASRAPVRDERPSSPLAVIEGIDIPVDPKVGEFIAQLHRARSDGEISAWEHQMGALMASLYELNRIQDALTARVDLVRQRLREGINQSEEKSFSCVLGGATVARAPEVVEVFDANQIPAGMMKIEPDKTRIAQVMRAGGAVAGAMLVTKGNPTLRVTFTK
jgi:hypothetical protein